MNGEQADILAALQAIQRRLDSSSDKKKVAKPELKGAGNKEQYEFCDKIGELIDTALDATNTEDVAAASIALTEAKTEVAKRQKLIKIADRSAQGWQTVKEYVRDDLCDGSDDEKRLKKVICLVLRMKIHTKKKKKIVNRFRHSHDTRCDQRIKIANKEKPGPCQKVYERDTFKVPDLHHIFIYLFIYFHDQAFFLADNLVYKCLFWFCIPLSGRERSRKEERQIGHHQETRKSIKPVTQFCAL